MIPKCTNADCVNFPNTIFPNRKWMVPRPIRRTIWDTPFGSGGSRFSIRDWGIQVIDISENMLVEISAFRIKTWSPKTILTANTVLICPCSRDNLQVSLGKLFDWKKYSKFFGICFGIWVLNWVKSDELFHFDNKTNTFKKSNNVKKWPFWVIFDYFRIKVFPVSYIRQ